MKKLDNQTEELIKKLLQDNPIGDRKLKVRKQLRNYFFRETIHEKFNQKCARCKADGTEKTPSKSGKTFHNLLDIHHDKYDWVCPYEKKLVTRTGNPKAKVNSLVYPCEKCEYAHPNYFKKCVDNCTLLCHRCHYGLHIKQKFSGKGWLNDKKSKDRIIILDSK